MPLKPDDTLLNGQYCIRLQLGRGGYGFVYQAEDTVLRKDVAIKELIPALLPTGLGGDEQALKRFLAEARATMDLTHEHIVRTHTVFPEGGNYYIVMAYLPGGSLDEHLEQQGRLPVDDVIRLGSQVAAALAYAHARGVVHCDLKPANILLAHDGTYRVADFGIAHVSDQMMSRTWHTSDGLVAGTVPYMSPEQTTGQRDNPLLDVYALGAVLYHALTGRPYVDFGEDDTPMALADNIYRIHNEDPLPPSQHQPEIPSWLDDLVLQALRKKPEERMSMAELQVALEARGTTTARKPQPRPSVGEREGAEPAHTESPMASQPVVREPKPPRPVSSPDRERRLRKQAAKHQRRLDQEEARLREIHDRLRLAGEQHPAQAADDSMQQEDASDLAPSAPGTAQWATRLRQQIEEAIAGSMQAAAILPDELAHELGAEAHPGAGGRPQEKLERLWAARRRLEETAQRHSDQTVVRQALQRLESMIDEAASKLEAAEVAPAEPSVRPFPDLWEAGLLPDPGGALPDQLEADTAVPSPDKVPPPQLDVAPLLPLEVPPSDETDVDLERGH